MPQPPAWPVLVSNSLAAKTLIGVVPSAIASVVDGPPEIEAKREVEIVMADPGAEVVTVGGLVGTPLGSTFQTDETALKLRWKISWALRDPRGLAWMTAVNW